MKTKTGNITCEVFRIKSIVELERKKEGDAAVKIHSWFRRIQVQKYLRHQHECATLIQRAYRAYTTRKWYRRKVQEKVIELMKSYYDEMATKIQSLWKGYFTRKYKFNFYTRKTYLDALLLKNESIRLELEQIGLENCTRKREEETQKQMNLVTMEMRKNHHLLSTAVCPGIYNNSMESLECSIRNMKPFSKKERLTMKQKKMERHLKTCTGIPFKNDDDNIKPLNIRNSHTLPPLRQKPQGPFRLPNDVAKQRYKELEPTLRVATDFQSADTARVKLRDEELTKRIIDNKFLPSTRNKDHYLSSLHRTSDFQKPDYGSKHFREPHQEKFVQETAFQRVVSPIPYFDKLGKTY